MDEERRVRRRAVAKHRGVDAYTCNPSGAGIVRRRAEGPRSARPLRHEPLNRSAVLTAQHLAGWHVQDEELTSLHQLWIGQGVVRLDVDQVLPATEERRGNDPR